MSFVVKHQEIKKADTSRAFKGIMIASVSIADNNSAVTVGGLPDFSKVWIRLINKRSERVCFDMPLLDLWRFMKRNDRDILNHVTGVLGTRGHSISSSLNFTVLQAMNLDFSENPYDGQYRIEVETRDAFPIGFRNSSYLEIEFVASDSPMLYEAVYSRDSLDARTYSAEVGNGVEEIVLVDSANVLRVAGEYPFERAGYSAREQSIQFTPALLLCHTLSMQEQEQTLPTNELTLHDGEILTAVKIDIVMKLTGSTWSIITKKLMPTAFSELSFQKNENRLGEAYDAVEQS